MRIKILMVLFGLLAGIILFFSGSAQASPSLQITNPKGGENFGFQDKIHVTWTSQEVDSVMVDLFRSEDGSYFLTAASSFTGQPNTGSYDMSIPPSAPAGTYIIRIHASTNSPRTFVTPSPESSLFTISSSKLSPLVTPVLASPPDNSTVYELPVLKWEPVSGAQSYRFEIAQGPSGNSSINSVDTVALANTSLLSFATYKWRVKACAGPIPADAECGSFSDYFSYTLSNAGQSIIVVSPNGGEKWEVGRQYQIQWSKSKVDAVDIKMRRKSELLGYVFIASNITGTTYTWTIPKSELVKPANDYIIWVFASGLSSVYDISNNPFTIIDQSASVFATSTLISTTTPTPALVPALNTTTLEVPVLLKVVPITGMSSIKDGSIVKAPGIPDVYIIKDGQKVKINSPQEFEQQGYKWNQIQTVQADLLAQIAELKAQVKQLKEDLAKAGALLKSITGNDVYVIKDGKKEKIQDPETFNKRGYKWDQIQSVSQDELASIPDFTSTTTQQATIAPALPPGITPGSLVKSPNSPTVYFITPTGAKKPILNIKVFNAYNNKWDNVKTVSQDEINSSPTVNVIRIGDDPKVYFISNGQKQWVKTPEAFAKQGLKWDQIVSVNKIEFDEYKEGEEIE